MHSRDILLCYYLGLSPIFGNKKVISKFNQYVSI